MHNPFAMLRKAARGDLEAQRSLARQAFQVGCSDGDMTAIDEAVFFGRLAFENSREAPDGGFLLQVMGEAFGLADERGETEHSESLGAQALALAAILTDDAPPDMREQIEQMTDDFTRMAPPGVVAHAQKIRRMMTMGE